MIQISGLAFDSKQEAKVTANLLVDDKGNASLSTALNKSYRVSQLSISPRNANTTRYITLPNGQLFETQSNDSIDNLQQRFKQAKKINSAHAKLVIPVLLLAIVLFSSWSFIHYGIPGASYYVAMKVPERMLVEEGQESFQRMDRKYFSDTELKLEKQQEIDKAFAQLLPEQHAYAYKLHFRHSAEVGANALALPSGDIIITDDLVNLSADTDEINAVLLHEIAHVELRHSVQSVVQTSVLLLGVVLITGDITSLSTVLFAIPALLLDSGYSRRMETEADDYSLAYMKAHKIAPVAFSNILIKITDAHYDKDKDSERSEYWSSHPSSDERIGRFRMESRIFKNAQAALEQQQPAATEDQASPADNSAPQKKG